MDQVTGAAKKIAEDAYESAKTGLKIGLFVGAIAFVYTLATNASK
jgi:hypothetical protein